MLAAISCAVRNLAHFHQPSYYGFFVHLNIAYSVSVRVVPFTNGIRNTQHGIRSTQCSNGQKII